MTGTLAHSENHSHLGARYPGGMKWTRVMAVSAVVLSACGGEATSETGRVAGSGDMVELGAGAGGPPPGITDVAIADEPAAATTTTAVAAGTTTTMPGERRPTTTTPTPPVVEAQSIEPLIVTAGPAGYRRESDREAETGAVDFDAAVYDDGEEDSAKFFRRHHFEAGWDRAWSRGDIDDEDGKNPYYDVYDTVYRFREGSGAEAYMRRVVEYIEETNETMEFEATTFTVPGVPGAKGYVASEEDFGSFATVVFTKGRYTVQIDSTEESKDKAKEVASAMARDQYARL